MTLPPANTNELELVVRQAGKKLMSFWPGNKGQDASESLGIQKKADGSIVTKADFASNEILLEGIRRLFPDHAILSEEVPSKNILEEHEYVWIIDPLDGTKPFSQGRDDFSVLVGLSVKGAVQYGIMYFPVPDEFARAEKGGGAFLNGAAVTASGSTVPRAKSVYVRNFHWLALEEQGAAYTEYLDSGQALLNVCKGVFDGAVIRMTTHKEWDIAAPLVIIEESGGRVTDERGAPISFSSSTLRCKYLVASNGKIHQQLLDQLPK